MSKLILFFSLVIGIEASLCQFARAQEQKPSKPIKQETADEEVVNIDTTLVSVPVVVKNRNGGYIPNLRPEQFSVFEDGVKQDVEHFVTTDKPFTIALILDVSDSTRIDLIKIQNAAIAFLGHLKPADRAMIVVFDKQVVKLTDATSDRNLLTNAIRRVRTGGGTALYDVVDSVLNSHLKNIGGRKAVVMLTDGIDTSSLLATLDGTIRRAGEQYSLIYPIQYRPDNLLGQKAASMDSNLGPTIYTTPTGESISSAFERGNRYLRLLAHASGGRFYYADSIKNLERTFAQIADELRQQYTISYYPKDQASNKAKRRINVTVDLPEAEVKTRESYTYRPNE